MNGRMIEWMQDGRPVQEIPLILGVLWGSAQDDRAGCHITLCDEKTQFLCRVSRLILGA